MSEDKAVYRNLYRCPSCFINWQEHQDFQSEGSSKICDFCEKGPEEVELLERRLNVLAKVHVSDLPVVLKQMYKVLSRK